MASVSAVYINLISFNRNFVDWRNDKAVEARLAAKNTTNKKKLIKILKSGLREVFSRLKHWYQNLFICLKTCRFLVLIKRDRCLTALLLYILQTFTSAIFLKTFWPPAFCKARFNGFFVWKLVCIHIWTIAKTLELSGRRSDINIKTVLAENKNVEMSFRFFFLECCRQIITNNETFW